ncbi:unnamed protein product [Paramecium sonneborni]|uniref:Protein YIF1 n=1 Tax=Paramecium sonneborni TaxID=65129 RepID=A0A8S1LQH1_9CILI|nr:unnamed protein product [Paramecium sonneborni]
MKTQQDTSTDPFAFAFNPQNIENTVNNAKNTLNNPLFGMAYANFGKKFSGIGDKYDSLLNQIFSSQYRYYFDVDNMYVVKKSIMTIAPYLYRGNWALSSEFQAISPTENVHAPDLYLPLMSLITFVLLRCLNLGITDKQEFNPGYIVDSFWKCLVISFLEVIIIKIVFCFLDGIRVNTVDLISHLNYRYCSLCALMVFNILINNNFFSSICTVYVLICQAIFVYKTLQRYSPSHNQSALELSSFGSNITLLLSLLQPFCSWILLSFGQ